MATLLSAEIKPGTTPILSAVVGGEDIREATVYVTINSGGSTYTKSNYYDDGMISLDESIDEEGHFLGTEVTVMYTQEETLCFRPGYAKIEIGWVFEDDSADKTNLGRVLIPETLIKGVMRYGRNSSETIE